ncbi:hypothetical protein AgCh_040076 [Apium graveolens]
MFSSRNRVKDVSNKAETLQVGGRAGFEQGSLISSIFWQKCAARTKDNLSKDHKKSLHNAGVDHENAMEHMHEYSPWWWCTADIWEEMCNQWRDKKWLKKRKTASSNRARGGEKAKGTYKGGSISELQHIANKVDVYVKTRDGLPEAVTIAEDYRRLFDERYPKGTEHSYFDQDLWDTESKVKKNYVKAVRTPVECVRAICRDPELLHILGGHLGALDPKELARAVVEVNASNQGDSSEGGHRDDHDDEFDGSS